MHRVLVDAELRTTTVLEQERAEEKKRKREEKEKFDLGKRFKLTGGGKTHTKKSIEEEYKNMEKKKDDKVRDLYEDARNKLEVVRKEVNPEEKDEEARLAALKDVRPSILKAARRAKKGVPEGRKGRRRDQ